MSTLHPVHLVGAGPGDPELLTLKAVRVLREATVILVDDLVGAQVLDAVFGDGTRPRVVRVGKRGHRAGATPQAFIEKLLIREALAGERVVRLKGGDPLVFGRVGEEISALRAAGVEVRLINGITSGLAAANALGVGWTDRRVGAQGVLLLTGHAQGGGEPPDWHAAARLARSGTTLIIYMGVQQVAGICAALGDVLPQTWPAAVVQQASLSQERRAVTTLGALPQLLEAEGFESPAILVLGPVVALAAEPAASRQGEISKAFKDAQDLVREALAG